MINFLKISTKIFVCAQSETNIRMSHGTSSIRFTSHGLSYPFLKTFAAIYSDPIDRPLVSEDDLTYKYLAQTALKSVCEFKRVIVAVSKLLQNVFHI